MFSRPVAVLCMGFKAREEKFRRGKRRRYQMASGPFDYGWHVQTCRSLTMALNKPEKGRFRPKRSTSRVIPPRGPITFKLVAVLERQKRHRAHRPLWGRIEWPA